MRTAAPNGLPAATPAPSAQVFQDGAGINPADDSASLMSGDGSSDEAADDGFKALTPEQAAVLKQKLHHVSPWRITAVQTAVGVSAALIGWWATQRLPVLWSMLYGMAAVVVPGGLMAWGIRVRPGAPHAGVAAVRFMTWELIKIAASAAMLVAALRVVPSLSWPALLVALVLCMKVNWLALLWRGRSAKND